MNWYFKNKNFQYNVSMTVQTRVMILQSIFALLQMTISRVEITGSKHDPPVSSRAPRFMGPHCVLWAHPRRSKLKLIKNLQKRSKITFRNDALGLFSIS